MNVIASFEVNATEGANTFQLAEKLLVLPGYSICFESNETYLSYQLFDVSNSTFDLMFVYNETQQLQLVKDLESGIQFSLAALVVRNQSISIDYAYKKVGKYKAKAKLESVNYNIVSKLDFLITAGKC